VRFVGQPRKLIRVKAIRETMACAISIRSPRTKKRSALFHSDQSLRDSADAVEHATAPTNWRAASHQHPQHVVATLAGLAQAGDPLPGPREQLCRIRARAEAGDEEKKDVVLFALNKTARASWEVNSPGR
jgi:hypothetical protein